MANTVKPYIIFLLSLNLAVQAGSPSEPKPMRRSALTEGRPFSYNTEGMLNRLSYRLPYWYPELRGDGVQGGSGSVKSNELYNNLFFQKTLKSDTGKTELIVKGHRFEDYDGTDDSLIVGIARYLAPTWKVALLGDVYGDKSESDIYFETHWTPSDSRYMRFGLVMPDAYYNSKRDKDDLTRYDKKPQTWFLHYREGNLEQTFGEFIINVSPESIFDDPDDGLKASGEQTHLAVAVGSTSGDWKTVGKFSGEWTDRDYLFSRVPPPLDDDFKRRSYELMFEAHAPGLKYWPRFGMRHLYLSEEGWFGDARNISGRLTRREPAIYGGGSLEIADDTYLEPMLHLSWADINHTFDDPEENRDVEKLIGKATIGAKFILDKESGAFLYISAGYYLHKAAFGGGSIRITWPF